MVDARKIMRQANMIAKAKKLGANRVTRIVKNHERLAKEWSEILRSVRPCN